MSRLEPEFLSWLRSEEQQQPNFLGPFDDDSAALKVDSPNIITSTDMFIEGIHFDFKYWTSLEDIGYKAVVHSVSDVYSKLVYPEAILVNACFAKNLDFTSIKNIYLGIFEALKQYNLKLVGGDFNSGTKETFLAITSLGQSDGWYSLGGAKAGDSIFVERGVGYSSLGLRALQKQVQIAPLFTQLFFRPQLDLDLITNLPKSDSNKPNSSTDISDSVIVELENITRTTGTSAKLNEELILDHFEESFVQACSTLKEDPLEVFLNGGEDFKLLVTGPETLIERDLNLFKIGELTEKSQFQISMNSTSGTFTQLK